MEKPSKIIRISIHTFLQNYHHFAVTAAFLVYSVSAAVLLSQSVLSSSSSPILQTIYFRLHLLFEAAGFPPGSQIFSFLKLKLSQAVSSSIITLPFSLSFLLIGKAFIIQILNHRQSLSSVTFSSVLHLHYPLLLTHLCNSFLLLSANAAGFSLLFLVFNSLDLLGLSSPNFVLFFSTAGAVVYSIILANALIICNMAIIVAGMEACSGFLAILKACVLIRGRAATALSLALTMNLALAAVEALFQYRVVRAYRMSNESNPSIACEAPLIVYMYSILIVLDTVMSCIFFKSCKRDAQLNREDQYNYRIKIMEEGNDESFTSTKTTELP